MTPEYLERVKKMQQREEEQCRGYGRSPTPTFGLDYALSNPRSRSVHKEGAAAGRHALNALAITELIAEVEGR